MTRTESLLVRQQQFDTTLEALRIFDGGVPERVCLLDSTICDSAPEELLDYQEWSKPAKATPEQLALLEEVGASTTDESLKGDLRDIIVFAGRPEKEWVRQLEIQARALDFLESLAKVIAAMTAHVNEHEDSATYSPDEKLRRDGNSYLDELLAITCPRRHEMGEGDLTAYFSEDDYGWLVEQRFILEAAGIDTREGSDYDIILDNVDEAGFLEDQTDLELAIVD